MTNFTVKSKNISLIHAAEHIPCSVKKLRKMKIKSGDRIAVLADNCPHFAIITAACWEIGAVIIPVSIHLPSARIHSILKDLNCNRIIVDENINYSDNTEIKSFSLMNFLELGESSLCILKMGKINLPDYDFPSDIMLSSGTSSKKPKAILHSLENHYYSALGSRKNINFNQQHIWLANLPMYHISGFSIIMRCLVSGSSIGFAPREIPVAETVSRMGISHLSVVPAVLHECLKTNNYINSLAKLNALLVGGGPASMTLIEESFSLRLPVLFSYGSTEMSSQITVTCPGDSLKHLKTCGKILKYRELKISTDNEIMVKGKTLFKGYIKNNELLKPFDSDGWFKTRDIGYLDSNGYLSISGRMDSMFISGGENIYPEEIEKELLRFPEISDALIVPAAHPKFGEIPVAFIKTQKDKFPDMKTIEDFLSRSIEKYKIPKYCFPWPQKDFGIIKPSRHDFKQLAMEHIKNMSI